MAEEQRMGSPGRVLGQRSASPAKRTAADMEGSAQVRVDGDVAMGGVAAGGESAETQTQDSAEVTSGMPSITTKSSATSLQSEELPPYSAQDQSPLKIRAEFNYTTEDVDKQEAQVLAKSQKELDEGQLGIVVSKKWLQRVQSRSTQGLKSHEFPKEAREGPIGLVDNSDIVPEHGFDEPIIHDMEGKPFIPLKPGLSIGIDFEVLNNDAWGIVVGAYGMEKGQKQIQRYVRNTAGDAGTNLQYELWPPVFTIKKVPQPTTDDENERPTSAPTSVQNLYMKATQRTRGQMSPDDAAKIVSSRQERFQDFLRRSKEAAGIKKSKVRIFKVLDPSSVTLDTQPVGTQASSVSSRPAAASDNKLIVSVEDFKKMEVGQDLEYVDAKDETDNPKYNGASNMEIYILTESATLILEEQIGGPGGGEYSSDKNKGFKRFSLLAAKKDGASRPGSAPPSGRTSPTPGAGMMTRGRTRRDGRTRGTVGLNNLGNTCYMNSALQCIRSVEELAVYFLSGKYKSEINMDNPLGHKGAMAKQYALLLGNIYADNASGAVSPANFKRTVGGAAPMFSGYGQQDSQEFLSFLVDALHEDLNRIHKKPYNENPDSTDETVKDPQKIIELGEVYRNNFAARNESVAMDLFSGFYKNTMECPKCDKISITFDPYSLLTVQLPHEGSWQHTITFVPLKKDPINHAIDCDKNWTVKTLMEHVASKHPGTDSEKLWMIEVYSHKIYKVFEPTITIAEANVQANDYLFIYELDAVPSNQPVQDKAKAYNFYSVSRNDDKVPPMNDPKADCFAVPVFSRQKARDGKPWEFVMHPVYITVTREDAQDYDIILKKVLIAVSRLTTRPILTEMNEDATSESSSENQAQTTTSEEGAQVTDTSGSEDGYVNVSKGSQTSAAAKTNGVPNGTSADKRKMPDGFMDPEFVLSPELRSHLFMMNYAINENSMHCTGMSGIKDASSMFERVKKPVRRNSVISSSDSSTASTASGTGVDDEDEEVEDDDMFADQPDIVLGDDEPVRMSDGVYEACELPDMDDLPDNPLQGMSRKGRRKNGRKGKGKKGGRGNRKHGKHNGKGRQNQNGYVGSLFGGKKVQDDEDNPYYIKLGEGIVLDWFPEALDGLFNGGPGDEGDLRGHFTSAPEGKGLPFFYDADNEAKKERREKRRKHGITLDECFKETGKREVLSEDNAWYCNRCKELRRATKTLEIWTCPDILVVHLKRFGGNRSFRDKIDTLVEYPVEGLDMSERVGLNEEGKEYLYDLFAVDCHFGGLGGGHYTAMAKNFFDGEWYDYNDTHCSRLSDNRLQSAAAYLLFYRRRSDKPLGPQYLQDLVVEARNQTSGVADPSAEEGAQESDSGEGRLGGPNGSLRGPSSVSQTGLGAASRLSGGGASGPGRGAGVGAEGSLQMAGVSEINGKPVYGPPRPPEWNFSALDGDDEGVVMEDDTSTAIITVEHQDGDDGDADSTTAILDQDGDRDLDDFGGYGEYDTSDVPMDPSNWPASQDIDPFLDSNEYQDDHSHYSSSHQNSLDALHLEDASSTQEEMPALDSSPPTPERVMGMEGHDKTD